MGRSKELAAVWSLSVAAALAAGGYAGTDRPSVRTGAADSQVLSGEAQPAAAEDVEAGPVHADRDRA